MDNSYMVLQSHEYLEPEQPYYRIKGFHNFDATDMGFIEPTPISISNRRLEWLIPDTAFNRGVIFQNYGVFKILDSGQETKAGPSKVEESPAPEVKPKVKKEELPTNPFEIKRLKANTMEKLDELGVSYSKTSTLSELREALANSEG